MDPLVIMALVNEGLKLLPQAISLGKDVTELVGGMIKVTAKGATAQDVSDLRAISDAYAAEIAQPIPDEEA